VAARLIRLADAAPQPWRNGGGTTRELLAWPSAHAWRLRVSVADVARDGPFSPFPGVERWFAVLDGNGVELATGGQSHRLTADVPPMRFSGEAATTCRLLDGPTRDLNLMLRGMRGGMFACLAGEPWRPRSAQCGLFAAVDGRCHGEAAIDLPARCLLWFDAAPASLSFAPSAAGVAAAAGWWLAATPMEDSAWA
jgi:hypothetical protein